MLIESQLAGIISLWCEGERVRGNIVSIEFGMELGGNGVGR